MHLCMYIYIYMYDTNIHLCNMTHFIPSGMNIKYNETHFSKRNSSNYINGSKWANFHSYVSFLESNG